MADERGTHSEGAAALEGSDKAERASSEKRVALVIGNGKYDHGRPLSNPHNDAAAIAAMFARLGFALHGGGGNGWHADLGLIEMRRVFADFSIKADGADMAAVYFAGHGMEINGENYLLPKDCELEHVRRVAAETVSLTEVMRDVEAAVRLPLVILDACRVNEFAGRMRGLDQTRSALRAGGMKDIEPSIGDVLVAYAARHGAPALDGLADDVASANSPYAQALLDHLETPDVDVRRLFDRVRDTVRSRTHMRQIPHYYASLGAGDILLMQSAAQEVTGGAASPIGPDADDRLWVRIEGSDQIAEFEFYLEQFPVGRHAPLAKYEIRRLRDEQAKMDEATELKLSYRTEFWKTNDAGKDLYRIFAWVEGADSDLARLAKVVYMLDRTFRDPRREVTDRASAFQLKANAWGEFDLHAVAHFAGTDVEKPLSCRIAFDAKAAPRTDRPSVTATGNVFTDPVAKVNQAPLRNRGFGVVIGDGTNDRTVRLAPGETAPKDAPFAPEMVLVPPGKFWMGARDGEGDDDERPRHEMTIRYPLLIGRYPVTFEEWDAYVDAGGRSGGLFGIGAKHERHRPGDEGWGRGRRPVINVSWHHARTYAAWLSLQTGKTYRLLSEAEWEYACRAGTETTFSFGDTITRQQAQFSEVSLGSADRTVEVGSFPANLFGLHDMHGNVWEWCEDTWADDYQGAPSDGSPRTNSDTFVFRVMRGGSWYLTPQLLRSANRHRYSPDFVSNSFGFRLARTLNPTP
ncbi:MAG: SUMF1/EgtB/PvdO family nonheme iron enzyme [Pseudomonadota bacterium]